MYKFVRAALLGLDNELSQLDQNIHTNKRGYRTPALLS